MYYCVVCGNIAHYFSYCNLKYWLCGRERYIYYDIGAESLIRSKTTWTEKGEGDPIFTCRRCEFETELVVELV